MDKKAVKIIDLIEDFNKDLEKSKPLHEVQGLALDNQKKDLEIQMLRKQLNDYNLTRFMAWIGGISAIIAILLKAAKVLHILP